MTDAIKKTLASRAEVLEAMPEHPAVKAILAWRADAEHRDHVKAHAESPASIADGLDAALIGRQLDFGVAMAADEPGGRDHAGAHGEGHNNLQEER